jgi:hypothetical protein
MHLAPADSPFVPFSLCALVHEHRVPSAAELVDAPSFFSFFLFFFPIMSTAAGAINGDQVKHIISS